MTMAEETAAAVGVVLVRDECFVGRVIGAEAAAGGTDDAEKLARTESVKLVVLKEV